MPIFKTDAGLIYFAHVPKCGGTTIENAIKNAGYQLSFIDLTFWKQPCPWYKSSPQHILASDLLQLFDKDFFFYKFAVVRDPIDRFLSAFNHNRKRIGWSCSVESFVTKLEKEKNRKNEYFGWRFDNHFVPAARFLPDRCKLFRLETGLENVLSQLSKDLDLNVNNVPILPRARQKKYYSPQAIDSIGLFSKFLWPASPHSNQLERGLKDRIARLYAEDYEITFSNRESPEKGLHW